jgi:hypothetical protein
MQLPFIEQLVLLLVDKLVLGVIVFLIGLLASQFLERYKARQNLLVEISKARISRFTDLLERFEKL